MQAIARSFEYYFQNPKIWNSEPLGILGHSYFNFFFFFQGQQLHYSLENGVIITNQSLVLQKVSRTESGLYQCHAINQEGEGSSNTVNLPIKCKYSLQHRPLDIGENTL